MLSLTLYLSSPDDVRDERQAAGQVVERLQSRYWKSTRLTVVAAGDETAEPGGSDAFIAILWSKLSPPQPALIGRPGLPGTERELEAAAQAGKDLEMMIFRRSGEREVPEADRKVAKAHLRALEGFWKRFSLSGGTSARVATNYETVDDFSTKLEQQLETLIQQRLRSTRGVPEEALQPGPVKGSPFRGSEAFRFEDAGLFFGRERAITEALEQLKRNQNEGHPFLMIYGAAGAGKTSLIQAGLAPRLTAEGSVTSTGAWRRAVITIGGTSAVKALADALTTALPELSKMKDAWDATRLTEMLARPESLALTQATIVAALDRVSAAKPAQLLITLDDLEPVLEAPDAGLFFKAIAALVVSRRIWVIGALGSEAFPRVAEQRELFQLVRQNGGFFLGAPDEQEIRQIVRCPALAADLQFEAQAKTGQELSERIIADANSSTALLPALEFALQELYTQRRGNILTWADYEKLGGLAERERRATPEAVVLAKSGGSGKLRFFQTTTALLLLAAAGTAVMMTQQQRPQPVAEKTETGSESSLPAAANPTSTAAADFDAAATRIADGSPDEALPFLVSALQSDPQHLEAQALLLSTLRQNGWHVPVLHLQLPQTVHQLAFGPESDTLFATTDDEGKPGSFQALMRWDLDTATLPALLEPAWGQLAGALSISPDGRHLIVRRGDASQMSTVLCDALTMAVESKLTPAGSVDAFCWSPDGLLFGYAADDGKGGILWRICDAASGATIRESESFANPEWSAVTLGRTHLKAVAKDGTVVEVPLNPKFPTRMGKLETAPAATVFSPDGSEILAEFAGAESTRNGVYTVAGSPAGDSLVIQIADPNVPREWTRGSALMEQLPWSQRNPSMAPAAVRGRRLDLTGGSDLFHAGTAPFREDSGIEAVAAIGRKVAISSKVGGVTLHEWLPSLAADKPQKRAATGQEAWVAMGSIASGTLEKNGTSWRLNRGKDGPAPLAPEIKAAAISPTGNRIIVGGDAGLWAVDAISGELLSGTEPIENVREIVFLADGKRIAVAGSTEVAVLEFDNGGFTKLATLPVSGALGLKELDGGNLLAVADSKEVGLFETKRFSRTGTLTVSPALSGDLTWAENRERGWLACARGAKLDVWSWRTTRPLAMGIELAEKPGTIEFKSQDDETGILCGEGSFVPLARSRGLDRNELAALQELTEAVGGTRLDPATRALGFLSLEERKEAAAKADATVLIRLLPEVAPVLQKLSGLTERQVQPEAMVPLWNRLAFSPGADGLKIARWAQGLGKEQPWFRAFTRCLIAESDRKLYEGKDATPEAGIPELRRMAGEDETTRNLMKAAWQSRDLVPVHRELRAAALLVLNDRVTVTAANYEAASTTANAISHAEALALRADPAAPPAAFLSGKVGAEEDLTLEQTHFLIASGLASTCSPAIDRNLKALQSPWLWIAWLDLQAKQDRANLPGRIQQVMMESGGRGPVAARALGAAFQGQSPEAIAIALAQSKGMPQQLVDYATGRALWLQGKKAEVFAMWPQGPPDLQKLAESNDWNGWEQAVSWEEADRFSNDIAAELGTLKVQPGDTIETQRALATKLMDPKTATIFGGKRVRDAIMDLALTLAYDKGSSAIVLKMVDRARLTGADPVMCLRAEARNLYAMGQPTSAYSRWIQILDAPETGLIGTDCIEAAQCLVQDQQGDAAVELLLRGPSLFPHDPVFAYQAAWMLLGMNHPEQAGIVLDHGFKIPFTQDQLQMATAMLVCAAELTQRTDRANQAFRELVQFDPSWGTPANLNQLDWPQPLKKAIMVVAGRNGGK